MRGRSNKANTNGDRRNRLHFALVYVCHVTLQDGARPYHWYLYLKSHEAWPRLGVPRHPALCDAKRRLLDEVQEAGGARGRVL